MGRKSKRTTGATAKRTAYAKKKAPRRSPLIEYYERTFLGQDQEMMNTQARQDSFSENNWPFPSDSRCTPENMAAAGFYFCGTDNEPDLVRCYYCRRELDGWEEQDDPWQEHSRRSCPFIDFGKDRASELLLKDAINLELQRSQKLIDVIRAKRTEQELRNVLDSLTVEIDLKHAK